MIIYSTIHECPGSSRTMSPVIVDLEGNENEVLYIQALGKDLGISIRLDDSKTGVVISTKDGVYRSKIEEVKQDG